jgi:alpha-L-fucosidase
MLKRIHGTISIVALFMVTVLMVGIPLAQAADSLANAPAPEGANPDALQQWRTLKYGMFIHFGMATFTGRANENDPRNAAAPSTLYAPTDLDVDQWIRVAHDAGMKYAVLTAKHTAGHCLWDSTVKFRGKEFDYDVATSGNKTDVVAEFVKACKKYDVKPGLYWCLLDFHNNSVPPGPQWNAGKLPEDFFQLAQDQFTELIKNYPDICYYWLDVPNAASAEQRRVIYDLVKRLRPGTVVLYNNHAARSGGKGAWPTDVLNTERDPIRPGEFKPEQTWDGKTYQFGYEHCDCLGRSWFWVAGDKPRPIHQLYGLYHRVTAAGGNLLLDVPPDRSGHIPEASVKALMELKQAIDAPSPLAGSVSLNAKATASNVYRNDPTYGPQAAVDGDDGTRWATDDCTSAWLEVDLGKPVKVGRVVIEQAYPELKRVKKFAIEYRDGNEWKACYRGENLGETLDTRFEPVTAQQFRLNVTEVSGGPTIWEFQLFKP